MDNKKYINALHPKYSPIYIGLFFLIGVFSLSNFSSFEESEESQKSNSTNENTFPQHYQITSPIVPTNIDFCGEEVPIQNFEVRERLEREFIVSTYYHSSSIIYMKRANRWFPVIEPILKKYGIPDDFKYLSVIESGLENVVSPKGARGFWQFIKSTGKKYGLEINREVDERYNVEKSTVAACKYLLDAFKIFGSWTLAAASYNFGMTGIKKQIKIQKAQNYYNLVFGEETSRYLMRIIATKAVFANPHNYGFKLQAEDLYKQLEFKLIPVNNRINNLADFAISRGINYKILKSYNPWLRKSYLKNKRRKLYQIKVPTEGSIEIVKE